VAPLEKLRERPERARHAVNGATRSRLPWLLRVVRARPRLFLSGAIAVIVTALFAVAAPWRLPTRLLAGWDIGVTQEDEGQAIILVRTVAAALASLAAIFAELGTSARADRHPLALALAMVTILLSWAFIHTIFALHYAHEFYDVTAGGGMAFPGGETGPDHWDFVYVSFVIGMTSQVSDVGGTSKQIRRIVAAHGVVSFVFNAALLALMTFAGPVKGSGRGGPSSWFPGPAAHASSGMKLP
jgi:uncharacterized membrane protein